MTVKESQYKKILRDYEVKRDLANRRLKARQEEVYAKIPRIAEIDKILSSTGIEVSRLILQHPEKADELIKSLEQRNLDLVIEKAELLYINGYDKDYLEPSYNCNDCKDTGYIDHSPCHCFKQALIDVAYDQSNLKDILSVENFDNFNFDYYSDEIHPQANISPKENIKQIYSHCIRFVNEFDETFSNLIFYGDPGLGKTFLCNCIAKDLLDRGKTVLYLTAFQLFKLFEQERFRKEEIEDSTYLDAIFTVDLLIIDDLGTEFNTALTGAELFNCLNARLLDRKSTIISTNLSPNDWQKQYSERIISRVFGNYKALKFIGTDIRILKKYN
ncbi:MAG: replication protein DnaC [Epulopiscium sp.]|jgi:DNA replication protein DnaC|uniref:AAA family ATPase n=1 Tax=Defluviitalea raffinosedens TaxID=1450156 RepID=A0A7C8HFP0_9FIRM|nr:ATP-binding protein [Defluviitalea raffinosedens]MBZ4668977.1 family ATPase [Defluviitaleaceae bacterium]MDK2787414.1 replication protein DnaC [Candidatus Epulonipiscium sp.]KAE9636191.1 AAA family ATPase [Defluviitalea raffinosedens]MBM7684952.1 DNA replication protein DnaC [Defluviitalea raffinosedens]HHW66168.1 ATP-binding protein [Candidatus Epulonipiscium sp.]